MQTRFPAVMVITRHSEPEVQTLAQFLFDNRNGMTVRDKTKIETTIAEGRIYQGSCYQLKPFGTIGLREIVRLNSAPERHGRDLPWMIIHRGEVAGGTLELASDRVNAWVPGCFAVPLDETLPIYVATGGDAQRGAEKWEVLPATPEELIERTNGGTIKSSDWDAAVKAHGLPWKGTP